MPVGSREADSDGLRPVIVPSVSSDPIRSVAGGDGAGEDARFQVLVDEINDYAIVSLGVAGEVASWGEGAARLSGYRAEDIIGRHFSSFFAQGDIDAGKPERLLGVAASAGRSEDNGWRLRQDGSLFWANVVITRLLDDHDEPRGFVTVTRDASVERARRQREQAAAVALANANSALSKQAAELSQARKEAERASLVSEKASRAKSAFLATMSHEIRTPMNAVIGMTGLLLETSLSEEQQYFTQTIRDSGEALVAIINNILDFSKIESEALDLEVIAFDVQECAESAMSLVAHLAAVKGLELVTLVGQECPQVVLGDETRFRQVLVNLLTNAVKFSSCGEVVLSVDSAPVPSRSPETHLVRLDVSVRDTGIGIPAERLSIIFEPFCQVDSSTTRVYGGTGLGLAISQRLVRAMGGELAVTSTLGEGSSFSFSADFTISDQRTSPRTAKSSLDGKSVLIVDDNASHLEMLTRALASWGMQCTAASEPAEAIRILGGGSFDAAVLDLRMPQTDVADLAAAIRRVPQCQQLPLIALTSLQERLLPADRALFAAVLTKPVRNSVLHEGLLSALAADPASQSPKSDSHGEGAPQGRLLPSLRILVAEDNPVNQQVLLLTLRKRGHRVDMVGNGQEAVRAVELASYDVVLMDVQMPVMDGLEATRVIRAASTGRGPQIVAVTAGVLAEERAACLAAGMDDYLPKPMREDKLTAALGSAAARSGHLTAAPLRDAPGATTTVAVGTDPWSGESADGRSAVDMRQFEALIAKLGDAGPSVRVLMIATYLDNCEEQLALLSNAVDGGDTEVALRAAHMLRSSSAQLGANTLAGLLHDLERTDCDDQEDLAAMARRIRAEYLRVAAELGQLL